MSNWWTGWSKAHGWEREVKKHTIEKDIISSVESLHDAVDELRTLSLDFSKKNPPVPENYRQYQALQHNFNTALTALSGDIQLAKRSISNNKHKALVKLQSAKERTDELLVKIDAKWKSYQRASKDLEGFNNHAEQFEKMLTDIVILRQRLTGFCERFESLIPQKPQRGQ